MQSRPCSLLSCLAFHYKRFEIQLMGVVVAVFLTVLLFTVRLPAGLLQGQRTGAMWLVAGPGQNDEGRGKWLLGTKERYLYNVR